MLKYIQKSNSLKLRIISNFIGSIGVSLLYILSTPFYIQFAGAESYGLISFYMSLMVTFMVLDLGISSTISKELSVLSINHDSNKNKVDIANLVRTFELIYCGVGLFIGLGLYTFSNHISLYWLKSSQISQEHIAYIVKIMSVTFVFRWASVFYQGGLIGIEKQPILNLVLIISEILKAGISMTFLFLGKDISFFFYTQLVLSIVVVFLLRYYLLHHLRIKSADGKYSGLIIKKLYRFALGVSGISLVSTIISQSDKMIISKMFSLEIFAYYSLASTLSLSLLKIVIPISQAVYPRFIKFIKSDDKASLNRLFHTSSQSIAFLITPIAIICVFFSEDILFLWTHNSVLASTTSIILSILVLGTLANGFIYIQYQYQLAIGWTSLAFYINLISGIFLIPTMLILIKNYGILGATITWTMQNTIGLIVSSCLFFRQHLKSEKIKWLKFGIVVPVVVSVAVNVSGKFLILQHFDNNIFFKYIVMSGILLINYGTLSVILPDVKLLFVNYLKKYG